MSLAWCRRTKAILQPWHTAPRLFTTSSALRSLSATISQADLDRAQSYCSNLIRSHDSPAFTLQAFIPPSAQTAYLALRAFNIETALVADATSSSTIASLRMQFWRDTLAASLAGNPPREPVAILLAAAHADLQDRTPVSRGLSKNWLQRIVDTRAAHLGNPPFARLSDIETYAENTASALLYLELQALGLASVAADHLASHIGKATGLAALLRGLPLVAFPPPAGTHNPGNLPGAGGMNAQRQGAVLLPLDVMAEAGVVEEQVLREGAAAQGLRDAVFTVATRANDHLITAREMLRSIRAGGDAGHDFEHSDVDAAEREGYRPQEKGERQIADVNRGLGVLMQGVATQLWLDRLQKVDFDVFDEQLRRRDWRLPWRAYWAFKRGAL